MQAVKGFMAVLDCVAKGNLIQKMGWSRDYESLDQMKVRMVPRIYPRHVACFFSMYTGPRQHYNIIKRGLDYF